MHSQNSPLLITALILLMASSCSSLKRPTLKIGQDRISSSSSPNPTASPFSLDWPVDKARLTQKFNGNSQGRRHLGIDLAAKKGTPLLAAHTGRVVYTGADFSGFGQMVLIESGGEWATLYAHLDKIYVAQGQNVVIGDVIGVMGDTGRTTGVHLHFELRRNRLPVDPLAYLPQLKKYASN